MQSVKSYDVVLSDTAFDRTIAYKKALASNGSVKAGAYLKNVIEMGKIELEHISDEQFIQLLLLTKRPMMFAETEVKFDGSDWTEKEMELLGDLNIGMDVDIFDNGAWVPWDEKFQVHNPPLKGTLLFTPGPLLQSSMTDETPDLKEILQTGRDGAIDQQKYNRLIDRRMTPLFYYANEQARRTNVTALITLPGVGCGAFAGRFRGRVANHLNKALQFVLRTHAHNFDRIACIFFDPYAELTDEQHTFNNVKYRVRPSMKSGQNEGKPQLCEPRSYEETNDDFSGCQLFKIVAWDHVSFPGNDYFAGSRFTDDGVAAAATNSMEVITGISGTYRNGDYRPPPGQSNWERVVRDNGIQLRVCGNVKVSTSDGQFMDLTEFQKKIEIKH